jgi:hypothetical protein
MRVGILARLKLMLAFLIIVVLNGSQTVTWGATEGQLVEVSPVVQDESDPNQQYTWWENVGYEACLARYETAALFATITAVGIYSWNWGSSDFRFNSEGWFGSDTGSGGSDKLGHAFTSYAFTNLLTEAMLARGGSSVYAPLTAGLISTGLMTYVELFDGFSEDHGFSYEDMIIDLLGIGLAYARHRVPGLREGLDFRLEYWPSGHKGFRPLSDYSGLRYLLAFKLSGVEPLRTTPLRYVELHAGYYTRGFLREERLAGEDKERTLFVGIGVNLNELFFGRKAKENPTVFDRARRLVFEHIQVPYTSYRFYEDTKTTK